MTVELVLKPRGRGRWKPMTMTLSGKHAVVFLTMYGFQAGQRFDLAGVQWRVCSVKENPSS